MKIKFLKNHVAGKAGDVVSLSDERANYLIRAGVASAHVAPKAQPKPKPRKKKVMQKVKSILSLIVLLSVLLSVALGAGYLLLMLPLLVGLPVGVASLAGIALIGIYLYERGK